MKRINFLVAMALLVSGSAIAADSLKITVVGGGGTFGQRIVREALERGHQVTVVARDPARVQEKHERLAIVSGDVLDSGRMAEVAKAQDVLVSAIGSARAAAPDPDVYRKAAESLVIALRKLGPGAPRLIVVGGVGSLEVAPGKLVLENVPPDRRPENLGQSAALDYYRTISDVQWTYLSPPGSLTLGTRTGKYRLGSDQLLRDSDGKSTITVEDYAVALIDEAERPQHIRRRFTVAY
jgi:putative NADH-flavin reductase